MAWSNNQAVNCATFTLFSEIPTLLLTEEYPFLGAISFFPFCYQNFHFCMNVRTLGELLKIDQILYLSSHHLPRDPLALTFLLPSPPIYSLLSLALHPPLQNPKEPLRAEERDILHRICLLNNKNNLISCRDISSFSSQTLFPSHHPSCRFCRFRSFVSFCVHLYPELSGGGGDLVVRQEPRVP